MSEEKKYEFKDVQLIVCGQVVEGFATDAPLKISGEGIKNICQRDGRPLPKLTAQMFSMGSEFTQLLRHLFDDSFDISEEFSKHSSCRVELGAEVCEEVAKDLIESFNLDIDPVQLIGTWMCEAERDYSNGIQWYCVDEAIMVKQVTVTKTVTETSWKPISYVEQETTSPSQQ